jgi:outer membrane receptor protein involved in Fe transport
MNTQFVWGGDYQRTMPETFGTILPDGTGGRRPISYRRDGKDNDKDGKIDEWDELFVTNEFGLYAQSQTKLTSYLELVLAGRIDLHSGLVDDKDGFNFLNDPLDGSTKTIFLKYHQKLAYYLSLAKIIHSASLPLRRLIPQHHRDFTLMLRQRSIVSFR